VFQALKNIEYVNFVASSSNYRTIIAEKDYLDYLQFFIKNYSTYIGAKVPTEELPNPEELLKKARKAEEPVEKGNFVIIQPPLKAKDSVVQVKPIVKAVYNGPYSQKESKTYYYSIIYLKKQTDESKLVKAIETFNLSFKDAQLVKVTTEPLDDNRNLLIVNGLGEIGPASVYLQKSASDPTLSALFKVNNFRSFIISDENLKIFKTDRNLLKYMEFYNQAQGRP